MTLNEHSIYYILRQGVSQILLMNATYRAYQEESAILRENVP